MQAGAKIGLLHHVGGGNLGDDATLHAVAENLRRRWPTVQIVAFSMNPDDTEMRHGLVSHPIHRKGWNIGYNQSEGVDTAFSRTARGLVRGCKTISYLYKATRAIIGVPGKLLHEVGFLMASYRNAASLDFLIICGGGQLTEKDGPWGFPYTISKWVLMARLAGVRCIFLNVGAGPLTHPFGKSLVRQALRAADYVSFRDSQSQALVRKIGFTGKCRVCPDNAYSLDGGHTQENQSEEHDQLIVGLAPMPYPGTRAYLADGEQTIYDEFIQKLANFGSWLINESYAILTFGTDIGVDQAAIQDFHLALVNCLGSTASVYRTNKCVSSVDGLLAAMCRMDYVVTCRFHGVVFAHLLNKPVLAIAHHPKVMDLMSDLELSSYCVDIRNFDPALLKQRFALMINNADEIKSRMAVSLQRNRRRLGSQFDELTQFLKLWQPARRPNRRSHIHSSMVQIKE